MRSNPPVDVFGQVYAPSGGPVSESVRVNFTASNGLRPPEIVFTDSNGRFVLYGLNQGESYTVSVDAQEPHWSLTTVRFMPVGRRPTVQVYLNPYARPRAESPALSISASALRAAVPRNARRQFEEGLKELEQGDVSTARRRFEKAVELHPPFVEARNELAVTLMKEGNLRGAEAQLREALVTDATAVMPLLNLGLCIYRQERYVEAVTPLERAIQLQPGSFRGHLLLGMVWVMTGDDPRAEATLHRAYALGGAKAARAQFYLSHFYTRKKDYKRAAHALETYLHDAPADPAAAELQKTLARLRATSARN